MKIRTLKFYFKEGAVSLFKNRLMTLASIGTITSCIFLFILSYCVIANINYGLAQVESTVGISVFPTDNLSQKGIDALVIKLKNINNVTEVNYISPDAALKSMEADLGENSEILKGFESDNPLSKSFEIKVNSVENTKQVIADIRKLGSDVRKIKEAEALVSLLINTSKVLSVVAVIVVLILSVISVVIVMNTIKLTVYVRRKEINIMKYVGATDWFIRWPFIIEGVFIGLIGALLPTAILWVSYTKIVSMTTDITSFSSMFKMLDTLDIFPVVAPMCLVGGAVLGMFGSIYSVRKHLNV